jgi:hypothetical protein
MALTRLGPNQSVNLASNVTGTLPTANGGTGATSFTKGKVLQVVSTSKTDSFSTTSTSYVDVTGLSVSITPASSSNKIYVICSYFYSSESLPQRSKILRGSTDITGELLSWDDYSSSGGFGSNLGYTILDTPSTTSATTYKLQIKSDSGNNAKINGRWDSGSAINGSSSITVMEIEA